ncbi:SEC23-interacting protein [Spatholobus suberectus]|nr:SEC23-interacting protein [Spatholobus suberectus]
MQNGLDGNDLRLKLLQKSASRQADSNGSKRHMDLREKLSKANHPLTNSFNSKQHVPESRETSLLRQIPSARSSDDLLRVESMRSSYSPWTLDHIRRRSPDGFPSISRGISPKGMSKTYREGH